MTAKELGQQPAFPDVRSTGPVAESPSGEDVYIETVGGMTLRQHMATSFVQGWLPSYGPENDCPKGDAQRSVAKWACDMADALLEQLAKEQP